MHHQGCRLTCWRLTCSPGKMRGIFGSGRSSLRYNFGNPFQNSLLLASFLNCVMFRWCLAPETTLDHHGQLIPVEKNDTFWCRYLSYVSSIPSISEDNICILQNIMCILKPLYTHTGVFAHVAISNIFSNMLWCASSFVSSDHCNF